MYNSEEISQRINRYHVSNSVDDDNFRIRRYGGQLDRMIM